jgi:hypothetical protein
VGRFERRSGLAAAQEVDAAVVHGGKQVTLRFRRVDVVPPRPKPFEGVLDRIFGILRIGSDRKCEPVQAIGEGVYAAVEGVDRQARGTNDLRICYAKAVSRCL